MKSDEELLRLLCANSLRDGKGFTHLTAGVAFLWFPLWKPLKRSPLNR